ncbi:hypothetical protein QP351_07675 [Aerococcus sp. UMB7533]|nr:hypothetical protein [Aerococcus sp. UMB7533]
MLTNEEENSMGIALTGLIALVIGTLSFFISDYDHVAAELNRFYQEELTDNRQTIYDEDLKEGVKSLAVESQSEASVHIQPAEDYRVQVQDLPGADAAKVNYEEGQLTIQSPTKDRNYPLEITLYGPDFDQTKLDLKAAYLDLDSQASLEHLALEADHAEVDLKGDHSYPMQVQAGYIDGDFDFDRTDLAFAVLEGQLGLSLNAGEMHYLPAGQQGAILYKLGKGDQEVQLKVDYSAIDVTTTN